MISFRQVTHATSWLLYRERHKVSMGKGWVYRRETMAAEISRDIAVTPA